MQDKQTWIDIYSTTINNNIYFREIDRYYYIINIISNYLENKQEKDYNNHDENIHICNLLVLNESKFRSFKCVSFAVFLLDPFDRLIYIQL